MVLTVLVDLSAIMTGQDTVPMHISADHKEDVSSNGQLLYVMEWKSGSPWTVEHSKVADWPGGRRRQLE